MKKNLQKYKHLIIITVISFLIRFLGQPNIPYGFHRDEAGIAYSAYSIITTGKDEWGRWFPTHFKALGDYPPGGYNYLTALTMLFTGPIEIAERFPAILFGSLLVPMVFLFLNQLLKNKKISLITATLVAFMPWDIVQSRSGSEPIVALFFTLLGANLYIKTLKENNIKNTLLMILSYLFALYTYNAARIGVPLIHLLLTIYYFNKSKNKKLSIIFASLLTIFSISIVFISSQNSQRFNTVSIFSSLKDSPTAYYNREGVMGVPVLASRIFHNKLKRASMTTISNATDYLDGAFLFFSTGLPQRYRVPDMGSIYVIALPFLILGLLLKGSLNNKQKIFLFIWTLIGILPAAITMEDTHI